MMTSRADNRLLALFISLAFTSCAELGLTSSNSQKRNPLQPGSSDSIIYAALGDSTGTGLGARNGGYVELLFTRIQQVRPGSRLVNLSTAWATSADVLKSQMGKVAESHPTLVTVGIGINDVLQGVGEQEFEQNYEKIISQLDKIKTVTVIVNLADLSVAPMLLRSPGSGTELRIRSFNQCITRVATRHNLKLVDLYNATKDILRVHPELFSADGLHPSDAGYKLWADTMWPLIKQAIE
jgi:lysophospholipase L1-like esterase